MLKIVSFIYSQIMLKLGKGVNSNVSETNMRTEAERYEANVSAEAKRYVTWLFGYSVFSTALPTLCHLS
jgi:hypothetical protein